MSSVGGGGQPVKGSTGWVTAPAGGYKSTARTAPLANAAMAGALKYNYGDAPSGGGFGGGGYAARGAEQRAYSEQIAEDMKGYKDMSIMDIPDPAYAAVVRVSMAPPTDVNRLLTKQEQQRVAQEVTFGGSLANLSAEEKAELIAIANAPSVRTQKEIEDSIPDTIYNQFRLIEKYSSVVPEEVQKKVYNTVLTAAVIGVEKFPAIREVMPNIDTLSRMIADSPEQLRTMSIQQVSDAITAHVTDSKLLGSMVPEFIKTLTDGSDYKLRIQNVETLLAKQEIPDRIRASIATQKLKLTPEEVTYAAEYMPDAGILLVSGKMSVDEFRKVKGKLEAFAVMKEEIGTFTVKTYATEYIDIAKVLVEYGLPLEYANAALNDALKTATPERRALVVETFDSEEWQKTLEQSLNGFFGTGQIRDWYKDPDNRVISVMAGIGLGAVGGFLTGGPVGAIAGGVMGVFAGTELPQSLDSMVFAESTLAKLESQGLGDAGTKVKDWKTRGEAHLKGFNEAWKSGDFVAAEKELDALKDLEDERANWVEANWVPLYMAGVYKDEVVQIAKLDELIRGRELVDGPIPTGITPLTLPRFQPGIDNVVIYPAADKTKKYQLGKFTTGQIIMPPGDWVVQVSKPGEVPIEYKYNVSGKGGVGMGALSEERAEVFVEETREAVATYDVLKTSDVERQAMYDKGVRINVNTPEGWEVWDIEGQKWVDRDYVTVHSEGQKYVRARPKGSSDNPYWTALRVDNPAGVFAADIDQYSPQVASKDDKTANANAQGHVVFDGYMEGSKIYIDGKLADNPERMMGYAGLQGEHTVTIEAPGYEKETKTVWIKPDATQHMSLVPTNPSATQWKTKAELSEYGPGMGALELKGYKPNDIILVNGERLLPELIDPVLTADPGEYVFEIQREGFETAYKTVRVEAGEKTLASLSPTQAVQKPWPTKSDTSIYGVGMGAMALSGFKPDDIIMVNGERLFPDLIDPELTAEPGDYVFEIQRAGFQPEYKTVRVSVGEKTAASLQPTKPVEEQYKTQFELSQYGVGKGLLKFTGYAQGDMVTLDGEPFTGEGAPEDTKVNQGVHTVVINRVGFEPEYQEITVKAGEYQSVSLIPTKTPFVKSSGGGGKGGYGGSGGGSVGGKEIKETVVTVGPNCAGAYLTINKVEKKFQVGVAFNHPFGAFVVKIIKPDGKTFEQAMSFGADSFLYINPPDNQFNKTSTFPGSSGTGGTTTTTPSTATDVFNVTVSSEPEGAKVLINGSFTGDWTPAKVPLQKGYYTLQLYKTGYAKFETSLWVDTVALIGDAAEQKAAQEGY
jgi:hypothetical protein